MSANWENLNVAFQHFRAYIKRKRNPDRLSVVDLLHTRNFKAGRSSIVEREDRIDVRLQPYSKILREIRTKFGNRKLGSLNREELETSKDAAQRSSSWLATKGRVPGSKGSALRTLPASFAPISPSLHRS